MTFACARLNPFFTYFYLCELTKLYKLIPSPRYYPKKKREKKKREKKKMCDLFAVDFGDVPELPFFPDGVVYRWGERIQKKDDDDDVTITNVRQADDDEVIIISEKRKDMLQRWHLIVTDEQRRVLAWFNSDRPRALPFWCENSENMHAFLDMWKFRDYTWHADLPVEEDSQLVTACARILRAFDRRGHHAREWDNNALVAMFEEVIEKEFKYGSACVQRCQSALAVYNMLCEGAPDDTYAAEAYLRVHAQKMGAELDKCWLFVGTTSHIFAHTLTLWERFSQAQIGSPLAMKVIAGETFPRKDADFKTAIRWFMM